MRGSQGGSSKRQGSPGLAVSAGLPGAVPQLEGSHSHSRAQTCARAAGAFQGGFLSLRSAPGSRHVRSLPEAPAGAQGSPLTAAVGVDLGGRGGGE